MTTRQQKRNPKATKLQLPSIMLAYCFPRHPDLIHEAFMRSVLSCVRESYESYFLQPVGCGTGPLISRARNTLLEQFLETEHSHILFADTDMTFSGLHLKRLLELDLDIVGGLYYALDAQEQPVIAHLVEKEPGSGQYSDVPETLLVQTDSEGNDELSGPFEVSGLGMGFTLIKRRVIQDLRPIKRLWPFAETDDDRGLGEDLTFCLRARDKGFKSYLDPYCRLGHLKQVTI